MTTPDFSMTVVIPAYNAEAHLGRALKSIERQSVRPTRLIVVDDASTDATAELIRAFDALPLLSHRFSTNRGQSAALNWAITQVTTPWVTFLDADDEWLPQKLAQQIEALRSTPSAQFVCGWATQIDERNDPPRILGTFPARLPSALFIETESCRRVGPFPEDLRIGAVIDWMSRAGSIGLVEAPLEQVVYRRYIHGHNLGLTHASPQSYLRVVREHLARQRASTTSS